MHIIRNYENHSIIQLDSAVQKYHSDVDDDDVDGVDDDDNIKEEKYDDGDDDNTAYVPL